jgi:transglutaminase-like putative cysteine protease
LFAFVFFYATPRYNDANWSGIRGAGGQSGFRPEVHLKERGRVHLSNQKVMRVALTKSTSGRSVSLVGSLIGEPYLTGAVMTDYVHDQHGSRWLAASRPPSPPTQGPTPSEPPLPGQGRSRRGYGPWGYAPVGVSGSNLVRQDIALESTAGGSQFAIMPAQPPHAPETLWMPTSGSRTDRSGEAPVRQHRYALLTPAIVGNRQLHGIPSQPGYVDLAGGEPNRLLAFDAQRFRRLAEVAAEVLRQRKVADDDPYEKALALEQHFILPGAYHYSLNLDVPRDPELDPIEDFVANHRTGHCEYFASALVLMLRSQGIPARLITGYHGGEPNTVGHYYVVKERHAHAWVEAWLPPGSVPPIEIAGPPGEGGVWYRLDPTPGRESYVAVDERAFGNRVAQAFDYVDLLWRDYVLSLNKNRQEDVVYEPLAAQAAALPSWVESRGLQQRIQRLMRRLGLDYMAPRRGRGPRAFEGGLALVVIVGLLLMLGAWQSCRWAAPHIVGWLRHSRSRRARPTRAPVFYLRLEQLLARIALVRRAGQTPRELAGMADAKLASSAATDSAAGLPTAIVAAYYRTRFGGDRLDNSETAEIERSLARLADAVGRAESR